MILGPRFLIEAGFIVAVAVVAGLANLSTWAIIGVVAAAWVIVALVEVAVWWRSAPRMRSKPSDRGLAAEEPGPSSAPEPIVVRATDNEPEREPDETEEPPREWNLWELERVARDRTSDDLAKNEERAYLLMYLREFAGPDGTLPPDFDGLVRDAFGDLLHVVAT